MAAAAQPVTISAAAAFKLLFGPTPIAPVKNAVISPAVTASVVDTFGNLTASTVTVTVSSQCVLKGTLTETAAGGVASFPESHLLWQRVRLHRRRHQRPAAVGHEQHLQLRLTRARPQLVKRVFAQDAYGAADTSGT